MGRGTCKDPWLVLLCKTKAPIGRAGPASTMAHGSTTLKTSQPCMVCWLQQDNAT